MPREANNDSILWQKVKAGDTLAFNHLYSQYVNPLFSFGLMYSNDKELIKDSIHDLFLELYKYRKNLADNDNIKRYIFKSFKRKIYQNQQKKQKIKWDDTGEISQTIDSKLATTIIFNEEDELTSKLLQAIEELPERQRKALILKFQIELPYQEVAEILGISVESTRTLIYRAIKSLRKSLSPKTEAELILLFLRSRFGQLANSSHTNYAS